jgi:hypothetical protein
MTTPAKNLRVLIISDNEDHAEQAARIFRNAAQGTEVVATPFFCEAELVFSNVEEKDRPNVIIADLSTEDSGFSTSMQALCRFQKTSGRDESAIFIRGAHTPAAAEMAAWQVEHGLSIWGVIRSPSDITTAAQETLEYFRNENAGVIAHRWGNARTSLP